jgi:hypothetical protein
MKTRYSALIFGILLSLSVEAQRNCHTVEYNRKLAVENPHTALAIQDAEARAEAYLAAGATAQLRDTSVNELINIPVVVHVLYNNPLQNISDEQILSQIQALNNDFTNQNEDRSNRPGAFKNLSADVRIRFCLAQLDPQNRRTTGIERKFTSVSTFWADDAMKIVSRGGLAAWNSRRYLNVWVCPMNNRTLGYATSPGSPSELDGVVISFDVFGTMGSLRANFNKGRTLTHEVGHWLGLKHIWGDTDCGDDDVDDTPRQKSYNFGCPSFPRITPCSETAFGDMFMNFMDFSDDACMNMFTHGQKKRMRAFLAAGNARNQLLNSFACDSSLVSGGPTGNTGGNSDGIPAANPKPVSVFPNPASGQITVISRLPVSATGQTLRMLTLQGRCLMQTTLLSPRVSLTLPYLPSGVYYVEVHSGDVREVQKLVVR